MVENRNQPRCTCGSTTPGLHGPGCPRQAVTLTMFALVGALSAARGVR